MEIEVWSDVACPFCFLGKHFLEKALEQFDHAGEVRVRYRSFQLDPQAGSWNGKPMLEYLAAKKGWGKAQIGQMHGQMEQRGKAIGVDFHFDRTLAANTWDALRLIQAAQTLGIQSKVKEALLEAYFSKGENISDPKTLFRIATEAGMEPEFARQVTEGDDFSEEVQKDIAEAQELGIQGVPFYVLDRRYGLSGAQPPQVFLRAIQEAWQSRQPAAATAGAADASCDLEAGTCTASSQTTL